MLLENDGYEYCEVCGKRLKPICETKHRDGICYCVNCYKEKYLMDMLKKLKERENEGPKTDCLKMPHLKDEVWHA